MSQAVISKIHCRLLANKKRVESSMYNNSYCAVCVVVPPHALSNTVVGTYEELLVLGSNIVVGVEHVQLFFW